MNAFKKILLGIAIIFSAIFLNGIYYVFCGQFKSVERLNSGRQLNLYECASIYTMHIATWALGWPMSPTCAMQCASLHIPHKADTVIVWNRSRRLSILSPNVISTIKYLQDKPIGASSKLAWNGNIAYSKSSPEHIAAIAINPCVITKSSTMQDGSALYLIHSSMQYPKYSKTKFDIGITTIIIHEGLFRYLQDMGWLNYYTIEYGIYESWIDKI